MERKFKVGDVIHHNKYGVYTIIRFADIGYIAVNYSTNNEGLIHYCQEAIWYLAGSNNDCKITKLNDIKFCPRCGSPLVEKMSIGLGEMIKKCFNSKCGWC